jgi:hypothetical protein
MMKLTQLNIMAGFLIVDPGNCVTDGQALADLVMRPQTLQQGFCLFSVFEPKASWQSFVKTQACRDQSIVIVVRCGFTTI